MSKIVFFDIDGTIWDWDTNIPESTITAIRQLRANGHKAFICSGRSRGNICAPKLFDVGFDGVIAACGNHVEMDGKILYEKLLEPALVHKVIEVCEANGMPVVLEGPVKHFFSETGFEDDPYMDYLIKDMGERARFLQEYTDDVHINKFSADVLPQTNYEAIKEALQDEFDFMMHDAVVLECTPKGTSKATGIEWLCNHLGVAKEDTYAIGDSINDMEMLQSVGHGIAMGNATQVAKDVAEYVTTDIHEDGIMNALKHYNLI
ncbi:MAG: Cof-type HAD-IIB family hydrolase [Lachnospiraceae bacterium]|nr:Cof-type HAD-IIB family hydrolase [Lachnospiraceae bacterium]